MAADYGERFGTEELEEALPQSAINALGRLTVAGATAQEGSNRLLCYLAEQLHGILHEVLHPLTLVIAEALFYTVFSSLQQKTNGFDCVGVAVCAAISVSSLRDLQGIFAVGRQTLEEMVAFSHALLPTLATAACAAGAPTSAGVKYAAGAVVFDFLLQAAETVVFPLVCAFTAAACANAALGGSLSGPVRFSGWSVKTMMKLSVLCFSAYLGISGFVAEGTDAAAVKLAKTALGALPVVGKTAAGVSESLVAGAGVIRNSVGVFGLIASLGILALPMLRIGLRYILFKAGAALLSSVTDRRISGLIESIASAYGMVLGLVGMAAVILFLSVVSLVKTVSG